MDVRIAVVSLWAEDVPAAAHFYRDVIGLPLQKHHSGARPLFDLGGTFLTILKGRPQLPITPEPPRFPLLAFAVENLDAAIRRLQEHGVQLPWGIESDAAGRWVMFHDPAGNLVELVEFQPLPPVDHGALR
jgi:catechol 2,3-dioxygenase-like lactoylglutathione lyase family enzyme